MFSEQYSVIVIPKDRSYVRRFSVSRRRIVSVLGTVSGLLLFAGVSLSGLIHYRQEYLATESLRNRGVQYEKERLQMVSRLEQLEKVVGHSEDFVAKLENIAGVKNHDTLGLNDNDADAKNLQPAALNLSDWKGKTELFDDTALNAAHLKTIDLQEQAKDVQDRLEKVYNFNRDAGYFWSAVPTISPVRGWVTSDFGVRRSPLSGRRELHAGLDIAGPTGSPVYAPGDGVVTFAGRHGGYGNLVILDHGYGVATMYGHNSQLLVKEGDQVKRGDLISRIGSTGRSTGPHVHYEVLVDGMPVNPVKYILE